MAKESTALAKKEEALFLVLEDPGSAIEALKSNLEGDALSPMDLDRVTIPSGGGTQWTIPSLEGDEVSGEIVGVLVGLQNCRAYWAQPFEGAGTPPDCVSEDGLTGIGTPGGRCQVCPMAQFGSDSRGKGQACKQIKRLAMLRPGSMLPLIVNLPPTSIRPATKYLLRLSGGGLKYRAVITKITLEKDKNSGGIAYSKAVFAMVGKLAPEQAQVMEDYAGSLGSLLKRPVTAADYQPAGEE